MTCELTIVIPARNEAANLPALVEEIQQALKERLQFEILCVDDGSDDDTPAVLRALKSEIPELRVIRHGSSCGQSTAVLTGVEHARSDLVATLDGDGQNDPADLPALLAAWNEIGDEKPPLLVNGHRRKRHDSWLRRISSKIANGVRSRMLRDNTSDSGCGIRVFRRRDYLRLPYFDHMHRFVPALIIRDGGRVVSVPVNHRPRIRGESKYGIHNRLWVGIVDLFGVRWLIKRSRRPQQIEEVE